MVYLEEAGFDLGSADLNADAKPLSPTTWAVGIR